MVIYKTFIILLSFRAFAYELSTCEVSLNSNMSQKFEIKFCFRCYIPEFVKNHLIPPRLPIFQTFLPLQAIKSNDLSEWLARREENISTDQLLKLNKTPAVGVLQIDTDQDFKKLTETETVKHHSFALLVIKDGDYSADAKLLDDFFKKFNSSVILFKGEKNLLSNDFPGPSISSLYIQSFLLDTGVIKNYYVPKSMEALSFGTIHLTLLISAYFIRKGERNRIIFYSKVVAINQKKLELIRVEGKLPVPVLLMNYLSTSILSVTFSLSMLLLALVDEMIIPILILYSGFIMGAAVLFNSRIVGSSGKLKPEWSKIKRVAIVVVPGALVGLILASFYCGFRKADGIYVMQNILTGFIVLAIVLLLNFKNLGAAIVTIVIKSVSTVIFMNITYYHENSLFYHSLFLKPRNTAEKIPFCEKVIQNGKTVLFDCAESVFQEKSPFMFFFTFAVQECLCQVPLYFFNSMRQMLVAIMFAMFCLIYNEEHSSKPSVWFTISIIFASTFGVSIETIFFYETNGGIDFFNFALLLAMLLSVAGKRREVKNLFCGWERSEYYDVLRTTTEVNSHMLCAPLESRAETLLHVRFPQHRLLRASSMTSILYDYLDYEGTFLHSRSMINHDLNIRNKKKQRPRSAPDFSTIDGRIKYDPRLDSDVSVNTFDKFTYLTYF